MMNRTYSGDCTCWLCLMQRCFIVLVGITIMSGVIADICFPKREGMILGVVIVGGMLAVPYIWYTYRKDQMLYRGQKVPIVEFANADTIANIKEIFPNFNRTDTFEAVVWLPKKRAIPMNVGSDFFYAYGLCIFRCAAGQYTFIFIPNQTLKMEAVIEQVAPMVKTMQTQA